MRLTPIGLLSLLVAASATLADDSPDLPKVALVETPEGGVQPQAVMDGAGRLHLVYLKGDPAASDVYYAEWAPEATGFGKSLRVNDEPGAAMALGTVRGAQLAVGRGGRVHVAWNGSRTARPASRDGGAPLLYSRSDPSGTSFEPPRNLMGRTGGLDGGASIAADPEGTVIVAWHGRTPTDLPGEAGRRLWIARSEDDGSSFGPEQPAWDRPTGACACCGTRALAGADGSFLLLYRAASRGGAGRDMILLTSMDRGRHFDGGVLDPWTLNACPMSTASLTGSDARTVAAWETRGQVSFGRVGEAGVHASPTGDGGGRKHPSIATNRAGVSVLAWSEGTGWQKGGALAWQAFDRSDRPIGATGRIERGIATWDLPAVVARTDGSFLIIH